MSEILPIADELRAIAISPEIGRANIKARRSWVYSLADKLLWAVIGAILSIVIAKLV